MYLILPGGKIPDDHGDGTDTPQTFDDRLHRPDDLDFGHDRKNAGPWLQRSRLPGTPQRWTTATSALRVPARAAFRGIARAATVDLSRMVGVSAWNHEGGR